MKSHIVKKPYLIAEIAQTHDGSVGLAKAFITEVAKHGADAVKFQIHFADEESSTEDEFRSGFEFFDMNRYEYWKRIEFDTQTWLMLREYAKSLGIDFIVSVFSLKAMDLALEIKVDYLKVGSGEIFNPILLEKLKNLNVPLILSSGLTTKSEIREILSNFSNKKIILMQCTSSYPTPFDEIGLNVVREYLDEFQIEVGLSDHSGSIYPSLASFSEGARYFEVHVVMHRSMYGPDVSSSLSLDELNMLRQGLDAFFKMYSNPVNKEKIDDNRLETKRLFTKSFYYSKNLAPGHLLKYEDLVLLKPNIGIPYDRLNDVVGKRLKTGVAERQIVKWGDLIS
jgi:N-acetylneuraminate synthase